MSPQNPAGPASAWLWATPAVPFALKPEGSESVQTFRLVSSPRGAVASCAVSSAWRRQRTLAVCCSAPSRGDPACCRQVCRCPSHS